MKFNQEIGKRFANVAIGVTENSGQGVGHMRDRYNQGLRNQPKSAAETHLARQNKILRDHIAKQKQK